MSELNIELKISADEYSHDELRRFKPIGKTWELFSSGLSNLVKSIRSKPSSRAYFLIGRYGMGKTLFIRKKITELIRLEPYVVPIYMPLRRLSRDLEVIKRREGVEGFLKLFSKWYEKIGSALIEDYNVWSVGKSLNGTNVNRLKIVCETFNNSKSLDGILKTISEAGLIPLIVFDELEALITRDSRWVLAKTLGEPSVHNIIRELFNNMYVIASGVAPWDGLIIFASVFNYEEWIYYPLKELALSGQYQEELAQFLTGIGVRSRSIDRILSINDINERLKAVKDEVKRVKSSSPLLQAATQERLSPYTLMIRYQASDYEEFARRLQIKLSIEGLPQFFEKIEFKPRTLINIAIKLRELGLSEFTYRTISQVIRLSDQMAELRRVVEDIWRKVVHAKWPWRLLGLLEEGLILFSYDVVLPDVSMRNELLNRLSRALNIKIKRPISIDELKRIYNILDQLRLKYKILRQDYLKINGGLRRVFYIDENLIRWVFGDKYDIYGEEINIREYFNRILMRIRGRVRE